MRLQRMLAHLPALVHPNPKSVLVVGFGAGVTAGSFIPYPGLERLVICEIEPLIPAVISPWFTKENNNVKNDERTQIYYDDARSFVRTADETFDIITSGPINPWVKGAASLYTKEYFEDVKRHLKPGGVVTQWVPLYESTLDAVRSELAFPAAPFGRTTWTVAATTSCCSARTAPRASTCMRCQRDLPRATGRLARLLRRWDSRRRCHSLARMRGRGVISLAGCETPSSIPIVTCGCSISRGSG